MKAGTLAQQSSDAGARMPRLTAILGVLTTIALCAVCATVLYDLRASVKLRAEQQALNLLQLTKLDVARNFEMFDAALRAAIDGVDEPGLRSLTPDMQRLVLFGRSPTAGYLGGLKVLDETGAVLADSDPASALPAEAAYRDAFRHHLDNPSSDIHIGRPSLSPTSGDLVITVSRRRSHSDGKFAGVAIGTMRLAYFHTLFQALSLSGQDAVTLFHTDGTVLMREPYTKEAIGLSVAGSPGYKVFSTTRSGTYNGTSPVDGITRFYTFARMGELPLILSVARSVDDIFSEWWTKALVIGVVVTGLGCLTGALTVMLQQSLWRRESAEKRVLAANAELAALAVTDALTGLLNRRRFDESLNREWRRALRTRKPLSILMIDADSFKAFNDTYGHQAGDGALKSIAAVLRDNGREGTDVACRVGGEEFALLMPEADKAGAVALAERIRGAVAAQSIPHLGSASEIVTVSIGVATLVPDQATGEADFLAAADAALYEAKAAGRNQVKTAFEVKRLRAA
jgi:diguanylate cyclase (GGDEF)-like protein